MKIIVTGSLGNISKPLTKELIGKGHDVTVISSKPERQSEIESLGAKAAIGTMEDTVFLTETFKGADVIYAMEALNAGVFFNHDIDFIQANIQIAKNYKEAIQRSGVKNIIHLSSIGAHMENGNGILKFHHEAEKVFNELPGDISIKFMRPVGFYYNMFSFIPTIKSQNLIIQNYGGNDKEPWVSPFDIASAIAEEVEKPFSGREIRYIASEEISPNEIAATLGEAIRKPDLEWLEIPDEDLLGNLIKAGMNPETAKGFVEMNTARRGSILYEDYNRNKPVLGKTKVKEFAKEFAKVYVNS
ncbi:NAD(P)H-binding protein [Chryseobacterium fluminis]|uniref:NmrA family NAD(P)-binding protein n=1 Tax=Chryseobacterium fluminis TaxID=2983606 RepID=UPI0022571B71|nr:NAD(P)H-binding protein [Chryseobacterium sp. MMS21-Ot14]UZT99592.1 NAD(P)H-binding protein [Chryseobacterium sp. MMS21-Ot14]